MPVGKVLGSLQIRPLLPLFLASKNCVGCKLPNVDLSSLNLNGANLEGADFSGSSFQNSYLQLASFNRATLTDTAFQGAHLQGSHFDNATLTGAFFQKAQLQESHFDSTSAVNAAFDGADLTGATLTGADLTQASLSRTTLTQTSFRNAKLYGAKLIDSNLQSANLSGAFLTNLPGKNISAATLTGAYLFNASFYQAQLSGADFTNASFYGGTPAGQGQCAVDDQGWTQNCATAAYATMNNTQFGGAYLFGVDFTHATVQGVQFGNAVLIGANFTAANLSADPTIGTNSGFSGSFLQGANLASANLNFISLANAFMDFTAGGNIVDMLLDGSHTVFPKYWNAPGGSVCAEPYYSKPTTVPTQNGTVVCPDGNSHAGGCGPTTSANLNWKSAIDISQARPPASYESDSTYIKAASTPICKDDSQWDGGGTFRIQITQQQSKQP